MSHQILWWDKLINSVKLEHHFRIKRSIHSLNESSRLKTQSIGGLVVVAAFARGIYRFPIVCFRFIVVELKTFPTIDNFARAPTDFSE